MCEAEKGASSPTLPRGAAGGPSEKKLPIGAVVVDEKHDRKQMQSPPERAVRKPRH